MIVKENKRRMKKSGKKFKNATANSRNIVFNALDHAHKKLEKNKQKFKLHLVAFERNAALFVIYQRMTTLDDLQN